MEQGLIGLALACAAFVGSHFILSGPLRPALARSLGEKAFSVLYSLVALATITWLVIRFDRTPAGPALWTGVGPVPWAAASVISYAALVFVLGSFARNPALPQANLAGLSARKPWGAFRVTRHPMMMGIALWAVSHILIAPTGRTILLCAAMIVLALGGAAMQDRRKLAKNAREWGVWMQRTRFWPDLRQLGAFGMAWIVGVALWLLVTFAHIKAAGVPAGVWMWAL